LQNKRYKQTVKKQVPINTWKPWKPVAIKKVEPYTLSEIENGEVTYSNTSNQVKIIAKKIV
jgi:hypothetical protein